MIGILLITHGNLGESLLQCACHVLNQRPPGIAQLGIAPQDDPLDLLPLAHKMKEQVDVGDGVLVLTDLFGATPSNIAMKLLEPNRTEAIAGVNLPMLLRAVCYRHEALAVVAARAIAGGSQGVMSVDAAPLQN